MTDKITLLTHTSNRVTKTWKADGTILPFNDAKYYRMAVREVGNMTELSALLTHIESKPHTCLIRGAYVGDDVAKPRDLPDAERAHPGFRPGLVRRALDYFDDQPLHAVLIDVDGFTPLTCDALDTPEEAIAEFVHTVLPMEWAGASYHWQLSSSFGHPSKAAKGLMAHLWFWLERPLTSAQLKAWAKASKLAADTALFNPVQAHFTANPVFEGCEDPVAVRSGFVEGYMSSSVDIEIDEQSLAARPVSGGGNGQRLREIADDDPIAQRLAEMGLIKSPATNGFNIECPFRSEHSTDSGESSTQYRLAHTGGHALSQFVCLHEHCRKRGRGEFLAKLGLDNVADDFEDVESPESVPGRRKPERTVPKAMHLTTDLANANRIVARFGKHMIAVAGQWYGWDGVRWRRDEGEVKKRALALSKVIHAEADAWRAKEAKSDDERKKNSDIAEALAKWATKSEMASTFDAAMRMVKAVHTVDESMIDADPWLLNCLNGTVDLRTGELKAHEPSDYITKLCPVEYDPAARAPTWDQTLAKVTLEERGPARPLAAFLQRWFGYCATGSVREQQFVVHYGQGSNGKSTVIDTVAAVLGDYAGVTAPGLLMSKNHDSHPTEIADLFGRRMVTAHETGEGGMLREDFVKQATGGDKLKARYMRADFFEFSPTHKIQLLTNYKPVIKGQDAGIWRRVVLMPYMAKFGTQEDVLAGRAHHVKDTSVLERLKAEAPGILAWLVRGARLWFQDGLQPPEAVLAASRDYQSEQDRIGQFVGERCELGVMHKAPLTGGFDDGLYDAYRGWCGEAGLHALSKMRFLQELERVVPCMKVEEGKQALGDGTRKKVRFVIGVRVIPN